MKLSKTNYIAWWKCAHNAWHKVNDKERFAEYAYDAATLARMATGQSIDELARELFPRGLILGLGSEIKSAEAVAKRVPAIFQPEFVTEQCITICDMLVLSETKDRYDLIEVKSSTTGNTTNLEEYIRDIAFQVLVLKANKVPLGKYKVMRLNTDYIRHGAIEIEALFMPTDLTDNVNAVLDEVAAEVTKAHAVINGKAPPPSPCSCMYSGRGNHCDMFDVINPHVPDYSVHDLSRVTNKKLVLLIDSGVMRITDIPEDSDLSPKQATQARLEKGQLVEIDKKELAKFLGSLTYPLSFLDFETFGAAVPRFDGYKPYTNIVFLYSLHILKENEKEPKHNEFLYLQKGNPDPELLASLIQTLPSTGSILVWNKSFEVSRLKEMAQRQPEFGEKVASIITRVVDLRDVISHEHYLHHGFKGRSSIEAILSVVAPKVAAEYDGLTVTGGTEAMYAWDKIVSGGADPSEAKNLERSLREYCRLDTYAMYAIWKHFRESV